MGQHGRCARAWVETKDNDGGGAEESGDKAAMSVGGAQSPSSSTSSYWAGRSDIYSDDIKFIRSTAAKKVGRW